MIKTDLDNFQGWKVANDNYAQLFARFCKRFHLKDVNELAQ